MPVTVFTNSPIAAKPAGVTPKTADPESQGVAPPTTTTATSSPGSYPPARPGAAPSLPAPTAAAQVYTPQPTPTSTTNNDSSPPPPQPGAVPTPPGVAAATRSAIPPPPKVGEKYQPPPPPTTTTGTTPYPPQMFIPAPTAAYPAQQHGTFTAAGPSSATPLTHTTAAAAGPTTTTFAGYGGGQNYLQHPPGYQQNANASGLDGYQRSAVERGGDYGASPTADAQGRQQQSSEEGGVWDTAKKWAQATGQKLAEAESEVWKRINKD